MPKKLDRCVTKVKATGKPTGKAYAICQAGIKKSGKGSKKRVVKG